MIALETHDYQLADLKEPWDTDAKLSVALFVLGVGSFLAVLIFMCAQ